MLSPRLQLMDFTDDPKPSGLTGADLVEAKAEREMVAANKAAKTYQAQHPSDWPIQQAKAASSAANDLSNIIAARKGPDVPNPLMDRLRAFLTR